MNLTSILKRLIFIVLIFFFGIGRIFSIHTQRIEEGRAAAMANTSVTLIDIWSIYHNQAGLGY